MRITTFIVWGLALAAAAPLYAQEPRAPGTTDAIEATVSNSVLQMRYFTPSPFPQLGAGDLDYGLLLSDERDIIASAALMTHLDINVLPRLTLQFGPQGYMAWLATQQKTDVAALALGANARYELIQSIGLSLFGSAFYSPNVLTFGSARNLYDFSAGADLRFTPRLTGVAGYRWLRVTLVDEPDETVENEVFAGLRWRLD